VLTEAENVRSGDDLWRARIADPTGTFTVYAGKYQPDAAAFLSRAETPQFVAVLGKARLYTREEMVHVSVWGNELNPTTETVRNNWVVATVERTLERVEAIRIALDAGPQSTSLRSKLLESGVNPVLVDGVSRAVLAYDGAEAIADIVPALTRAIETVAERREFTPANVDAGQTRAEETIVTDNEPLPTHTDEPVSTKENSAAAEALEKNKGQVLAKMNDLAAGTGVPYDRLIETLEEQGLDEDDVEEAVQELMDEGKCYEPKIGILKLI